MTGYGRASVTTSLGHFVAEIQSVNRKFLELTFYLPRELSQFETELKKLVSAAVLRGQVTVKIFVTFENETPVVVSPNIPLARQVFQAWKTIAKELHLSAPTTVDFLTNEKGLLSYAEESKNENQYRQALVEAVNAALKSFLQMRVQEGKALQSDILQRLVVLRASLAKIAQYAPNATEKYRKKLQERLSELLPESLENDERILREVAVYAERIDISEEITRFQSHLNQCDELLKSNKEGVGKTLEFLLQELGREINTIGSKASDVDVSRHVVEVKSELEKIREQIQNVE